MSDVAAETRSYHLVDFATVLLISIAAVATAWCGYQASRWDELQALNYSLANKARVQASVASARSNALTMVDIGLFAQYESALFRREDALARYLQSRFRPEFRSAFDAWMATNPRTNDAAPLSPFAMKAYRLRTDDQAAAAWKRADALVADAVSANELADRYVFLTVFLATVNFLGGIAIKARYPWYFVLTGVGAVMLCAAIILFTRLPVR